MEMNGSLGRAGQRTASPLETLTEEECWAHLRANQLGRLGIVVAGVPRIFPINYAAGEGAVVFRTEPGSKLAWGPGSVACFEIDDYNPQSGRGWSVMLTGRLLDVTHGDDAFSRGLRSLPVEPLAPGKRSHWLALRIDEMAGRAFRSGWSIPGAFLG